MYNTSSLDLLFPFASTLLHRELIDESSSTNLKYPPYNIIKNSDEKMCIEMAVAGLSKDDIEITVEEDMLYVRGEPKKDDRAYIHRGISKRSFTNRFKLADYVQVTAAEIVDGLLTIELSLVVPEEKKPRKIEIKQTKLIES